MYRVHLTMCEKRPHKLNSEWQSEYVNINPTAVSTRPCRPLPNCISSKNMSLVWICVRVMVLNATFNNISAMSWQSILLVEYPEKTTDYYNIILHRVHLSWAGFKFTTSGVIDTDWATWYDWNIIESVAKYDNNLYVIML
jgi:hypothetical protein